MKPIAPLLPLCFLTMVAPAQAADAPAPPLPAVAAPAGAPSSLASAAAPPVPSSLAVATSATPAPSTVVARPAPSRTKGRWLTYASFAVNAYTYLGATRTAPVTQLTPASRGILYQQLGLGFFLLPSLRLTFTFLFGETVSGLPAKASPYTVFGVIPWLVYTTHGFFTGAGPQLAPVSYGKAPNFDAGIFTATGYAVQLGRGFALPLTMQAVLMLKQRVSFALTPSVGLAYRF
jgi:hypothetical protein